MPTSPDPAPPTSPARGPVERPTLAGLRLLAAAVAGRTLEVRAESMAEPRAYVAGNAIVVDEGSLAAGTGLLRDQVVVQAAMLAEGSLTPTTLRALIGRPRGASRYCALEAVRAVRAREHVVPPAVARRVLAVSGIPLTDGPEQSKALAIGRSGLPTAPESFGQVRPLQALRAGQPAGAEATQADLDAARERAKEQRDDPDEEAGEESKLLKMLSSPLGGDNPVSRMMRSLLGQSSSPTQDGASGPSSIRTANRIRPGQRRGGRLVDGGVVLASVLAPPAGSARYPEWDDRAGRYRPDWATVHDVDPWNPDGPRDTAALDLRPSPHLRRGLLRCALAPQPRGRAAEGEQLHPDGVIDLALWRSGGRSRRGAAGEGPAPLPFVDVRRTRPDAAVMVLLDATDSTGDHTAGGVPVFDQHLALAYRLTAACESIGLPVGLYAFQSWGRGLLRVLRVKSVTERLGGRTRDRLAHIEPAGYTRIGGAIRHTTRLLERSAPGMKRVLVVISDGFPYDEGYDGRHATADTRQAMLEARRLGVGCVCVGVTAPSPDELRSQEDALAAASALHVGDPNEIERRLGDLIGRALRDARRRAGSFQDRLTGWAARGSTLGAEMSDLRRVAPGGRTKLR